MRAPRLGDLCSGTQSHASPPPPSEIDIAAATMYRRSPAARASDSEDADADEDDDAAEESAHSSSSFLAKLTEPPLIPFYKPLDYVEALARIYAEIDAASDEEKSALYLEQSFVFRGLDEVKWTRRSLRAARQYAATIHEKIVYTAWLKYEKKDEDISMRSTGSMPRCNGQVLECPRVALLLGPPPSPSRSNLCSCSTSDSSTEKNSDFLSTSAGASSSNMVAAQQDNIDLVFFRIGDQKVACRRHSMATLSAPFRAMLCGCFAESRVAEIEFSDNGISAAALAAAAEFSESRILAMALSSDILLELLRFSNKFCCETLKLACERSLIEHMTSPQDAIEAMESAMEEGAMHLMAKCVQIILWDLPYSLRDPYVARLFGSRQGRNKLNSAGHSSYALYSLLSHAAMEDNFAGDLTVSLLEAMADIAASPSQKALAFHQMGCVMLGRSQYWESQTFFELAVQHGHAYSLAGVVRVMSKRRHSASADDVLDTMLSRFNPSGWMYQERALRSQGQAKLTDLNKATELDPTLVFPYKYRAAALMDEGKMHAAIAEINRILGFKVTAECLEMRAHICLDLEDYRGAIRDIRAILSLDPGYTLYSGKVSAEQVLGLLSEHVERWTRADCWMQLYDRWSSVDDIGSLAVVHQMLDSEHGKGLLYFRQSLLLLRLNCPKVAMRSLSLARSYASSEQERLVYEGWILYDTGHREEALKKAEESISIQRSFEAFFLKAYALADTSLDPDSSANVIELLVEALKCPSDGLRKGQALNNLGSVYVDCGMFDLAADCYLSALKIRHTRAHQGLARVHYMKNDRKAAYDEMTKLIDKAPNNASAYEKRSEYCDRDMAKADLLMATQLDPLRTYPYRYRAAVLMDDRKEDDAIAELSKAILFKPDLQLLLLRAAFYESIRDFNSCARDCRAALSIDGNHQETLDLYRRVRHQQQG